MSSGGEVAGGIAGGIIGFFVGGPAGAFKGASIGMALGSAIDPPKGPDFQGPRLEDTRVQISSYGVDTPTVYGKVALHGNVIWLENNEIKEVSKKESQGGKGGGGSTSTTYEYFATFAVLLCEGEVDGPVRLWIGPDLIADLSAADIQSIIASSTLANMTTEFWNHIFGENVTASEAGFGDAATQKYRFYTGSETQMPDPRIEADVGIDNASAYRGKCYIVLEDLPLKKYANALPVAQIKVEIAGKSIALPGQFPFAPVEKNIVGETDQYSGPGSKVKWQDYDGSYIWGTSGDWTSEPEAVLTLSLLTYENVLLEVDRFPHPLASGGFVAPASSSSFIYPVGQGDVNAQVILGQRTSTDRYVPIIVYPDGRQILCSDAIYSTGLGQTDDLAPCYTIKNGYLYLFINDADNEIVGVHKYNANTGLLLAEEKHSVLWGADAAGFWNGELAMIAWGTSQTTQTAYTLDTDTLAITDSLAIAPVFTGGEKFGATSEYATFINDYLYYTDFFADIGSGDGQTLYRIKSITETDSVYIGDAETFMQEKESLHHNGGVISSYLPGSPNALMSAYLVGGIATQAEGLAYIIEQECIKSNVITADDIDVTLIDQEVDGYIITNNGSIRSSLSQLQTCYPFDVVMAGYKLKFVPRGQSSVASVGIEDLGKNEEWTEIKEMDTQLPVKVEIKCLDASRDYDNLVQDSFRENTEAVNQLKIDIPIVLSATQAKQITEVLLYMYWLERWDYAFTLPPPFRGLEPSDVITVTLDNAVHEVRLTSVNYQQDGSLTCTARPNRASVYTSNAVGQAGKPSSGTLALSGPAVMHLVDAPIIYEEYQNQPGISGVMAGAYSNWPGGIVFQSNDDGQSWIDAQAFPSQCTFGTASNTLAVHACNLLDQGNTLTVDLLQGELFSVTKEAMLGGSNIALYGTNGRWEVIRFQNATYNGDNNYTLDTLKRGDKGTEWATGLHQAGDRFILATDPDNRFLAVSSDSIGIAKLYKGVTSGRSIENAVEYPFTYNGMNLECLSPVHIKGRKSGNDWSISWIRRTRVGGQWRNYVDASLGEETESYEVDILNGSTVVRTITSANENTVYTSAQQVSDFGSNQSSIDINIYQKSAIVGRGRAGFATL